MMMFAIAAQTQRILRDVARQAPRCRRNVGMSAVALQKASDPIQQLFLDKVREYKQKSGPDGKLVEASPEIERELKSDLEKITKQYGGGAAGVDMTKFPTFKFADPQLDPISEQK